jgi:hypothetical protein
MLNSLWILINSSYFLQNLSSCKFYYNELFFQMKWYVGSWNY